MEYIVIEAESIELLQNRVSEKIQQGWLPKGGVSTKVAGHYWPLTNTFVQAMVKE
mgnify:FL=1